MVRTLPPAELSVHTRIRESKVNAATSTKSPAVSIGTQLEDTETLLREASHYIGADIQEMPEIRREGDTILFRAFAQDERRRDDIRAALANIPLVRPDVSDPEHPADTTLAHLPHCVPCPAHYSTQPILHLQRPYGITSGP
jgi:hypothetical protein